MFPPSGSFAPEAAVSRRRIAAPAAALDFPKQLALQLHPLPHAALLSCCMLHPLQEPCRDAGGTRTVLAVL